MNDFILLAGETKAGKGPAISCEDALAKWSDEQLDTIRRET
jgi:hypothetical protein